MLEGSELTHPKPMLLLCYVSLNGPQQRKRLARLFWPTATDPLNRLSVTLSRIRAIEPSAVEANDRSVWTDLTADVALLFDALEEGRDAHAIDLYRGRFLRDVDVSGLSEELEEWMVSTADDVSLRVQRALLSVGEEAAKQRQYGLAAENAEMAYDTGSHLLQPEDLIRAHVLLRAGRSPLADVVTKDSELLEADLAQSTDEARARLEALGPDPVPSNLKPPATSFIGRARDVAELGRLLALQDHRLITLIGPGGIGKSRLALEVASEQRYGSRFADGCFFVALEDCTAGEEIPARIADALGAFLPPDVEPLMGLTEWLGNRRLLLVLDNCEHLPEAALAAARLLRECPSVKVLGTSRVRLAVEEEWVFPVSGMSGPAGDGAQRAEARSEAVELFETRAKRTQPSFRVQPEDLSGIAAICRLTGGSPLALELASARLGVRSVSEIASEIQANLDFLDSTSRNARDRHRSLRIVFEHSWRSLDESERDCLMRLSVFRGGFRRDGAREVAGASYLTLASLVDRSLIVETSRHRYQSHPLLLQYASEMLAAEPRQLARAQERHAEYMLTLATGAQQHLNGLDGSLWLDRLELDHANLKSALAWAAREERFETLLDLTHALSDFWIRRGYLHEAATWFARVAERGGQAGDAETDRRYARALHQYAYVCLLNGDLETPETLLSESRAIHRRLEDVRGEAQTLSHFGIAAVFRGEYRKAKERYEDALEIAVASGGSFETSRLLNNLGDVAYLEGNMAAARRCFEESLALERAMGNRQMTSNVLGSLGLVALAEGDPAEARALLGESLQLVKALGITFSVPTAFEQVASLATVANQPLDAARLWGAARSLRETIRTPISSFARPAHDSWIQRAKSLAAEPEFEEAWQEGRQLPLPSAFDLAFTLL